MLQIRIIFVKFCYVSVICLINICGILTMVKKQNIKFKEF